MVYFKSWEDFQYAVEALYRGAPARARYTVNMRRVDGRLVLKVTDDKKVTDDEGKCWCTRF